MPVGGAGAVLFAVVLTGALFVALFTAAFFALPFFAAGFSCCALAALTAAQRFVSAT